MGKVREEYARRAEAPDEAAASKADDQIGQLQQQMVSNATAARKEMDAASEGATSAAETRRVLMRRLLMLRR